MKNLLVLLTCSMILFSCNSGSDETSLHEEASTEEHHYNESIESIELNGNEKWVVNDEMKPFVSNGEELLSAYSSSGQGDYRELAGQLEEQNNQLVQSCTMQGKSHDELHKWLLPHLKMIDNLKKAPDQEKADEIINDLQILPCVSHLFSLTSDS